MPARSLKNWLPMPPLSGSNPLVVRIIAIPLRDAGPWQDAPDCSQMLTVTRFVLTATPEPPLDPRGTRSVSYGLQGWPLHEFIATPPAGWLLRGLDAPPGSPGPPL